MQETVITPWLETSGATLRPLEASDAEALFAAHGDEQTHRFWSAPAHGDVMQTLAFIEDTLKLARAWAITEGGGEALGRTALFEVRDGVGDIGVIMRRQAQGRGLAWKALTLVCDYAFNQLDLHRLAADIDPDNTASISLFLRAGFQREGLLRKNWKTHVGLRDSVIMSKIND